MLKSLFKSQKTRFDPVIMYNRKKEKIKSLIASFVIVSTFIIASYYTNIYFEEIEQLIGDSVGGMLVYVIINIIDVILAPVSLIAVIGVASNIWGWIISALLTIIGWTLGGYIAFKITRKFGVPLIDKFIKLEKLHEIEKKVDSNHLFWSIVILRIIIPADLLSYALGLFSGISTKKYILATIIGVTPLGVTLAYLGSMPFEFQIIGFITVGVIIVTGIIVRSKFNKHKETNKFNKMVLRKSEKIKVV